MKLEALDISELKPKRTITEAYKSIPDNVYTKKFIPLTPDTLWSLQFSDWEDFRLILQEDLSQIAGPVLAERIEDGIALDKALKEGKIKRLAETMVYWGFPPNQVIRGDLHSSSSVMIYGPSHDISFVGVNDLTREIVLAFNLHMEDGYPVDWWWISGEDQLFDRRHMKLGYKLRELPQKFPDVAIAASKIRDILIDLRNERNPQWASASYSVALVFILVGITTPISNYDSIGQLWDGVNAQNVYKLPHSLFLYEPWPPMLNTFFALPRRDWIISLSRMLSGNQLYFHPSSKKIRDYIEKNYPDEFERMRLISSYQLRKVGIPLPIQSLNATPPQFDPVLNEWTSLEFKFPEGRRIYYDDLVEAGLSYEDIMSGVLFNITHRTKIKDKITEDHIISVGHGLDTKYLKPENWIEEEKRKRRAQKKVKKIKRVIKFKKAT